MSFIGFMYRQLTFRPQPLPASVKLSGQTAIVTGANIGLGFESSRELLQHGVSRLILAVRSLSKGEEAKRRLLSTFAADSSDSKCNIEVWKLDQEDFTSIAEFGKRAQALDRLDLVLLNAGIKQTQYSASPNGHESTIQVNHLATSLLSLLLLPPLQNTAKLTGNPSHLTFVNSEVHFYAKFVERSAPSILRRTDEKETFSYMERYYVSKLLNIFWARELSSRVSGAEVIITAVNPGLCASSFHRAEDSRLSRLFYKLFAWTPAQGGYCLTNALVNQSVAEHGAYFSEQKATSPSPLVISKEGKELQSRVWAETVELLKREAEGVEINW